MPDHLDLTTTGTAVGGAAIARDDEGRVVFVDGALAGERVLAAVDQTKKSFRRAHVVEVLEPAVGRIDPICPEVDNGCGGCDLAHASPDAQFAAKSAMVTDALTRVGRIEDAPDVERGPTLASTGFRTTIRAGVVDGRAGLRRRRSNDVIAVGSCRVAHPLVEDLLVHGEYPGASEVTLRVGAATGERSVAVEGEGTTVHEVVAGHRFRISPRSFFQTRADGAAALVAVVGEAIGDHEGGTLVDLCCGVGLFAAVLGEGFERVVAVESNRSATADARVNLAHLGNRLELVESTFERWAPVPADVVVADPSRAGLAAAGVDSVVATGAHTIVLVSCDAGSLGRDAGLFAERGYHLDRSTLVDLFPDTSHVEVVSTFRSNR